QRHYWTRSIHCTRCQLFLLYSHRAPRHPPSFPTRRSSDLLACRRKSDLDEVEKKPPRQPKTVVDTKGAVAVRIGHEPFPAHARPRLHEIRTHDHHDVSPQLLSEVVEATRVVERRGRIVDRAGSDDRDETVVLLRQDAGQLVTPGRDKPRAHLGERQLLQDDRGRNERPVPRDAKVACLHRTIVPDVPLYG